LSLAFGKQQAWPIPDKALPRLRDKVSFAPIDKLSAASFDELSLTWIDKLS
jgi:hypothetical protein